MRAIMLRGTPPTGSALYTVSQKSGFHVRGETGELAKDTYYTLHMPRRAVGEKVIRVVCSHNKPSSQSVSQSDLRESRNKGRRGKNKASLA